MPAAARRGRAAATRSSTRWWPAPRSRCMHSETPCRAGRSPPRRQGRHVGSGRRPAGPRPRCRGGAARRPARGRRRRVGARRAAATGDGEALVGVGGRAARPAPAVEVAGLDHVGRRPGEVGRQRDPVGQRHPALAPPRPAGRPTTGRSSRVPTPRSGRRTGTMRSRPCPRRWSPMPPWPCSIEQRRDASSASSAVPARSRPSRTRSMPVRASGCGDGSSTVHSCSLPMATRWALMPCSSPHSQVGRDPRMAGAPGRRGGGTGCAGCRRRRGHRAPRRPGPRPAGGRSSWRTGCARAGTSTANRTSPGTVPGMTSNTWSI